MKRIYVLAALLLSVSATSCGEDWLAVDSHDKIYIDKYYNSEARIYEALIAAYDPLQWFDWNGVQYAPLPVIYDIMSDDIYPGGADIQDNRQFHLMFDFAALPTNVCSSVWTVAYSGINRANCVMQYMPGVKDISEKNKALYLAEAKVLRAYYYNILWKLWGNIPYYEQNLKDPYLCPQSTADEVYANVVATLEDALKNGGLPMRQTDNAILGRVTFSEDGKYVYDPGEDGLTFINAGVTQLNDAGYIEDFDIQNTRQETTYTVDDEYTTLTFPKHTFLPYIAHDEMFDSPTFTIKELTAEKLVLVWYTPTGNGGGSIAWQMILVPEDYEPGEPEEPEFNKGAELDPAEYKEFLTGAWTWESSSFQHFGCGESIANPTNWWPAPADAKAGCSMYDDVMTFGADGSYTFDPTDGMTYRNAGVTTYTGAVVDSPLGDDFRVEAVKQTSTYTYSATSDAGVPCFTLPQGILFSYIANDDQLGDFRTYYITAMWENCIDISWFTPTGNGGGAIAWRYRLKRIK